MEGEVEEGEVGTLQVKVGQVAGQINQAMGVEEEVEATVADDTYTQTVLI